MIPKGSQWTVREVGLRLSHHLLVGATVATLVGIGTLVWGSALLALASAFCAPGVFLLRRLYAGRPGASLTALMLGPAVGFALSSLVLLLLWVRGARSLAFVLVAPAVVWLVTTLLGERVRGLLRPIRVVRSDALCLLLVLLLVPLLVGRPYAMVGLDVADGRAYRSYFTSDFVWKMAVVAEVAKGDVPPRNQYLAGEPLNYYWLPHLLSAGEYRAMQEHVRLDRLLLVNALFFGTVFMAFLYGFTRQFVRRPPWALAGIVLVILCSSFEGVDRLIVLWREGMPLVVLRGINIDAVTRWFYGALPIDGLQRLLLYQPQHHAMAYATGLTAILLLWQARRVWHPAVVVLAGVLLGAAVLLSAFSAVMITTMAAPIALWLFWRQGALRHTVWAGPLMVTPIAGAALAAILLAYTSTGESLVELGWHEMAIERVWLTLPMNFGLTLPLGIAGLALLVRGRRAAVVPLGIVVVGSFAFYFLVNVRDVQDVYVGWRAGHLLFVAFAPLSALAVSAAWGLRPAVRAATLSVVALLGITSVPTLAIDLYNTQDIANRSDGPGFKWTVVLSADELHALDWVRRYTRPDDIVQVDSYSRFPETWAYIPAFAERRMAAGLPLSMVPRERFERATSRVRDVFAGPTADDVFARASALRIDYLYLGAPERLHHPHLQAVLDAAPHLFPKAIDTDDVQIYQVGRVRRRSASDRP